MRAAVPASCPAWRAFLVLCLLGTAVPARAERLPIRFYTTADGLAHDAVYKIVRDSRGYLWFCTFEGLSRFDGYGFTTYGLTHGLPSQVVRDLLETRDGRYFVATNAGICRFNPDGAPRRATTGSAAPGTPASSMFQTYVASDDPLSRLVTALLQDRAGRIWAATFGGLYRLELQEGAPEVRFIRAANVRGLNAMIEDRQGNLWLGSRNGLHRLLPDGRLEAYTNDSRFSGAAVQSLLEDREGRVWAGTSRGGLWRLLSNPEATRSAIGRAYSIGDGLPPGSIAGLFQALDGTLWAGSTSGLIQFVRPAGSEDLRFHAYGELQGVSDALVHTIAEDRGGNLWLGTSVGAARFARSGITTFGEADGFKATAAIFLDRAGNVFAIGGSGSSNFLSRFNGDRFVLVPPRLDDRATREHIWRSNRQVLQDRAGQWWVASAQGLYRFVAGSVERVARTKPKAVYTTSHGLASKDITALYEDADDGIWVGTARGGLARWNRASGTFRHFRAEDGWPSRNNPCAFVRDRAGGLWIGLSIGGGLARYRDGRFTWFGAADGLPEGGILDLFVDSGGRLWIPISPGGVGRIDHPEADRPAIKMYTTAEGLAGNDVEAVTEDDRGRIYLGSARGIDRLDPATGQIRHYTHNDGALRGGVDRALRDRAGALWFKYQTGLVRLTPAADPKTEPPRMVITGLRVAGEPHPVSALGETEVAAMTLSPTRNQLQIDFVALGLSAGDGSRYEYKLEGAGDQWSALGEQRRVDFVHLAAGRYRFLVRATTADGQSSQTPASFSFVVLQPVWQRGWFVMLSVAALATAGYWIHRYRVDKLIELERVRARIAADLHDDIGSSLSQISVLSEVLRTQLGRQEARVSSNISLINRVSQEALDSMSDIVWAINPRQDHLSDLVRRMRRLASETLPARGIEFTFRTPAAAHDLSLGADTRRQFFLMFKETLTNIVRHSGCNRAEIVLDTEGPWLSVSVRDNGVGFDPDQVGDGNGLAGLRRRAGSLGGSAAISSCIGEGTTVTIKIFHGRFWRLGSGQAERRLDRRVGR